MRVMALDIGEKRIGIAISDPLKITAQGLETLTRQNNKQDYLHIWQLIKEYGVVELVVGLPKNMNGTLGPQSQKVKEFMEEFGKVDHNDNLKIIYVDERLTTVTAEKALIAGDVSRKKRKQVVDKLAATVILQNYLATVN